MSLAIGDAASSTLSSGELLIDTFVTEVSQDTWIYFPWDMGLSYQEQMKKGG